MVSCLLYRLSSLAEGIFEDFTGVELPLYISRLSLAVKEIVWMSFGLVNDVLGGWTSWLEGIDGKCVLANNCVIQVC